ncbi:hypothetical protein E4U21_004028 [Claviceps maximensis]|nr:hypothetical protein E4U21_004028 [Claviceps maximensis]
MSSNNGGTSNTSTEPFVWVLIPMIVIFSMMAFVIFIWNRKRRERYPIHIHSAWPVERGAAAVRDDAYGRYRRGLHWSTRRIELRSTEGLNELGEAPPPYDSKKPPGIGEQHGPSGTGHRDVRSECPPGYPAQPCSIHAANSRNED